MTIITEQDQRRPHRPPFRQLPDHAFFHDALLAGVLFLLMALISIISFL